MLSLILLSVFAFTVLSNAHARPSGPPHSLLRRGSPAQINSFLFSHNAIRTAHNATGLTWSTEYAAMAEAWADKCQFKRTDGFLSDTPYGELHAAATGFFPISTAINQFAKDAEEYDPAHPVYNHWTQIVWKSTTKVGCARSTCNDLLGLRTGMATYYVCFYDPAGNVIGQAPKNVQIL